MDEASVSPLTADGKKISGLTATLRRPEPGFLPLSLTLNIVGEGTVRARLVEGSFEGDDPAVVAPEEWDEEMDGPWEKPQIRLGGAVKPRFEAAESLASKLQALYRRPTGSLQALYMLNFHSHICTADAWAHT